MSDHKSKQKNKQKGKQKSKQVKNNKVNEDIKNKTYFVNTRDNKIPYTVVKTRRKTIGIIINRNGEVKVHVPFGVTKKQIDEIVQKKADWIIKKVNEVIERNSNIIQKEYINGEKFLYLGDEYTLEIVEKDFDKIKKNDKAFDKGEVLIKDNTMLVYISEGLPDEIRKQTIKESLIKWYKKRFTEIVKERINKYSMKLNVFPHRVVIKNQKTRWGSCSEKGNINLNWRLIMAPIHIIDYVVVHEMCHLKVMNHSKDFWTLVESIMPNYRECRKWVKANGNKLEI
ncbi:MAG TPA: M48 family metallopeptidase [Clostridiaceae bacterium]|nr:M48 family metallopeptidase [Clostridiaceae bacterium]